ncbi:OsmC family protein [Formosa sp. S-31]|uniref:OsmC family protein n=1 Tax=Formosa sp. S-31 TaxID=2790949 RepID=UPI003EBB4DBE
MEATFTFKLKNSWSLEEAQRQKASGGALKTHQVFLEKGKRLEISAEKRFKGDGSKFNPEELLLAALSSCHFMSYLYVCELAGIIVVNYSDCPEGILELHNDGSGAFSKVILKPEVTIENPKDVETAKALHKKAGDLCFIANSCVFPIEYYPEVNSI